MSSESIRANCRVSQPILRPSEEVVWFNGFAWSASSGMIHQSAPISEESWQQWLGTQ